MGSKDDHQGSRDCEFRASRNMTRFEMRQMLSGLRWMQLGSCVKASSVSLIFFVRSLWRKVSWILGWGAGPGKTPEIAIVRTTPWSCPST